MDEEDEEIRSIVELKTTRPNFFHLAVLKLCRCGLVTLEGVSEIPSLRELYVSFNSIEDLDPLWGNASIEILDLEGNKLRDVNNIVILGTMSKLKEIEIGGNPVVEYGIDLERMLPGVVVGLGFDLMQEIGRPSTAITDRPVSGSTRPGTAEVDNVMTALRRPSSAVPSVKQKTEQLKQAMPTPPVVVSGPVSSRPLIRETGSPRKRNVPVRIFPPIQR